MKFLVIRFSSLGDIILTTAFLQKLKGIYPESTIYYATKAEFAEILYEQPFVDKVIELKKKESIFEFSKKISRETFDCVFDLHKNPRSIALSLLVKTKNIKRVNKHTLYRHKLLHKKLLFFIKERETEYNIDDEIKLISNNYKDAKAVLFVKNKNKQPVKPVIGIAPGAKWETKRWPKEYFKELIELINKDKDCEIRIFGSKDEFYIASYIKNGYKNVVNFAGELSIRKTAEFMAECSLVVSNDSALMHLASALDIPVIAIFGPTVKEFGFYPKGKSYVLEKKELTCRPCSLHGTNRCRKNNHKCMEDIKPQDVYKPIKKLLEVDGYD